MRRKTRAKSKRRIAFVTGSRAEFGLMRRTLAAIQAHPILHLQIIATGMHLDWTLGNTIAGIGKIDATVPWDGESRAVATGSAIAGLAKTFRKLKTDVVLTVGDRVEAFAAATAAHLLDIPVAHIHGGDRAQGQADDSLRHAITKLAHIHFPATSKSDARIRRMGEDKWRIHRVGSPGIENIHDDAAQTPGLQQRKYALLVLHPVDADEQIEFRRARMILSATKSVANRIIIIYPNNDPGSRGIIRCWEKFAVGDQFIVHKNISREMFLGLLRDASVLIGNSSSGIIEAASFGTPVVDIGPRQFGRERAADVLHVEYDERQIRRALFSATQSRHRAHNPYAGKKTASQIADILAKVFIDNRLLRKVIAY